MTFKSKLPDVGTTIFTVMSQLAADEGAINLSQGFPDFEPPARLLELLTEYSQQGYNQYPPMTGVPALRQQVARKIRKLYAATVDADTEITITSGATEALFVAIQTVIAPGDEAIVFDPAYDSYEPAITLAGGKTIHLPLLAPGFAIDHQRLRDAITPKTRLIILNSPHNPCGSVVSKADLEALADLCEHHDLLLLSDEVYEHMVFDGQPHHSLLADERLRARTFVVSSFGKTYHATGWKVAYCVAPPLLSTEFRKIHQYVTFTTHTPSQWALARFLEECPEHHEQLPAFYQHKRDLFNRLLADTPLTFTPSQGTYFQLADYQQVSTLDDVSFARLLTREAGVAVIPISVFYENPPEQTYIRFCFAKSDETLETAAAQLSAYFSR